MSLRTVACLVAVVAMAFALPARAQSIEDFIGRFGLASYFDAKDAGAIAGEARAQCGQPYIAAKGAHGGVMLHLPDATHTSEHVLKTSGGTTYLGPADMPAGSRLDREVVSADARGFTLKWVDPSVGGRYGIMVFQRCGR